MPNNEIVPIVTSVNMDDYLSVTMGKNRCMFDRYYVLTSPEDKATLKMCEEFGAEPILYDRFFGQPDCAFGKSGAMRHAQEVVHKEHPNKWVLLLDTDIILPEQIGILDTSSFNDRWLYGMERFGVHSFEEYKGHKRRTCRDNFAGYFQMYKRKDILYDADGHIGKDWAFRDRFPRRFLIPDMHVLHIGRRQMHWDGRHKKRLVWSPDDGIRKILVSVTNFEMSEEADKMKSELIKAGGGRYDVVLIDSSSRKRPDLADEVIPNEYYTGLWNKSVSKAIEGGYESLLFLASDVQIEDYGAFCGAFVDASKDPSVGVYTPSIKSGSRCAYEQCLCRDTSATRDCEWVEGFCFMAKTKILKELFPVEENKYGWQIDTSTCSVARRMGYRVVVDDGVRIFHPHSKMKINRQEAQEAGKAYYQRVAGEPSDHGRTMIKSNPGATRVENAVAIVVGVNMDDYLSVTMSNNRHLFERYYVLTSPEDEATIKLCKDFEADVITYGHFFGLPGCTFNKSGGVRSAQELVHNRHRAKWVVLMDVDILLPAEMAAIDTSALAKRWLYGVDRLDAHTYEDYLSARLVPYDQRFSGYFQMYHNKSALYQRASINASWCDTAFRNLFPRRILIPEMKVIHIGKKQMHWNGRHRNRLEWGKP